MNPTEWRQALKTLKSKDKFLTKIGSGKCRIISPSATILSKIKWKYGLGLFPSSFLI